VESVTRRAEPVSGGNTRFAVLRFFPTKTAENSERTAKEQRTPPLFLRAPNRRRRRISAEKEMSTADNFLQKQQKQQKQREVPCARVTRPVGLVQLMNASEH